MLSQLGVVPTIADARFSKPLDIKLIRNLVENHEVLITVEEGAKGGFGAHVLHWLAEAGHLDNGLKVRTLTLKDAFIDQASPEDMYVEAGLDSLSIFECIVELLDLKKPSNVQIKIVN